MKPTKQEFYVIIERDGAGNYIGEVPQLCACYSQGETVEELMVNMREVVELCLEESGEEPLLEFVSIEKVIV